MGRPAMALDQVLEERLVKAIEQGATRTCAAKAAGISATTFFKWLSLGRQGDTSFAEFAKRIARAEATAETAMADVLFAAGKSDPKWATEWLARRRPRLWAKRDGVRTTPATPADAHVIRFPSEEAADAFVTEANATLAARKAGE